MADSDKAKSAAERLAAAKKEAEDAEIVSDAGAAAPTGDAPADQPVAMDAPPKPEEVETEAEAVAQDLAAESDGDAAGAPMTGKSEEDTEAGPDDARREDEAFVDVASEDPPETPAHEPAAAAAPVQAAHEEEHEGRTLAGMVLQWLFIFFIGAAAALWAGPKIAPHLPAWAAPVAEFLTPGANRAEEAVAELRAAQETAVADLTARLDGAEARLAEATEEAAKAREELAASLEGRIAAAEEAKIDTTSFEDAVDTLAGRVTSAEAGLEGLRAEVDALAGFTGENAAPSAETLERVAAFGASVEGLRGEVEALSKATAKIDALAAKSDLSALAERVNALEQGEAATASAAEEADRIRRAANIDAALTNIDRALTAGDGFAAPLGTAENLSGIAAPPALSATAASGAPTTEELVSSFQAAARDGYAAAMEAEAGDGATSRAIAGVLGRLGGRPAQETEGDGAGAVLSRIEARLHEGDPIRALEEARALPEPAAAAMQDWIAKLETAAAARSALAQYRAQLATN